MKSETKYRMDLLFTINNCTEYLNLSLKEYPKLESEFSDVAIQTCRNCTVKYSNVVNILRLI